MMQSRIILLFLLAGFFAACNKKLDLAPENTLVERDVFKTEAGTEQALAEAYYNLMQAATGNMAFVFGDFTTANLRHSTYYDVYDKGEVTPADQPVAGIWTSYFKAINLANTVIANIPVYAKFDAAKQASLIAEAKFIRAFAYLDLLKFFGEGAMTGNMSGLGLPLQLTPFKGYNTGDVIPRSTNGDVYAQIVKDLTESIPALPDKRSTDLETRSRATKGSANALLARTWLYMRDYANAANAAKAVLDKQPDVYALASDPAQLFPMNPLGSAQSPGKEYIMVFPVSQMVSSSTSANNNLGNGYFYKRSFWINPDFINGFETGDLRVAQLMFKGDSVYNPDRFADKTTVKFNNPNGRDNVPVVRLAEMMLVRAEALAKTAGVVQEAVTLLNSVRNRALPARTPYTTGSFATAADLVNAIINQRRVELAFEGFYRYDLLRTGQPLRSPDIASAKKVLPVPQVEIDISHGLIKQNTGY
jgi:starch-binding outer membrane protein, SusD/RagB family